MSALEIWEIYKNSLGKLEIIILYLNVSAINIKITLKFIKYPYLKIK